MIEQKVAIISNVANIQDRMNEQIKTYNLQGYRVVQIVSHASNHSIWTLLFEREIKDEQAKGKE